MRHCDKESPHDDETKARCCCAEWTVLPASRPTIRTLEIGAASFAFPVTRTRLSFGPIAPWQIGVEEPDAMPQRARHVVPLSGRAMATSGYYRSFFEQDGRRYSHAIASRVCRKPGACRHRARWHHEQRPRERPLSCPGRLPAGHTPEGYFWSGVSVLPLLVQYVCAPLCTGVTTPSSALSTVIAVAAFETECMNFSPSSE
jgi:hypothetical protein